MPKFAPKALFSILTIRRAGAGRPQWDRIVLMVSTAVTLGLGGTLRLWKSNLALVAVWPRKRLALSCF